MLKIKSAALRKKVFKEVKKLYEEDIVPYNLTVEGLDSYMIVYLNIVNMLGAIEAKNLEVRKYIGLEFYKWFFETHEDIVEKFSNNEL